jgi:hypothetical protein
LVEARRKPGAGDLLGNDLAEQEKDNCGGIAVAKNRNFFSMFLDTTERQEVSEHSPLW